MVLCCLERIPDILVYFSCPLLPLFSGWHPSLTFQVMYS
ncbi:unnamed protein product [Ixodes persulcatus]